MDQACSNALTVDVEDYFHASIFRHSIRFENWHRLESRVERNTRRVLELLAVFDLQATFFILGWIADRSPALVREIQAAGHDLGCHSYAHRLIYEMSPGEFRADTERARRAIEDASGAPVRMYRAPSFSITSRSIWAMEILLELGFTIDSSISPVSTGLYGLRAAPRQPFRLRSGGRDLLEFPLTALAVLGWPLPVTGGVYLRALPELYQNLALQAISRSGRSGVLYFHPWELDPGQPRLAAPARWRLFHYAGLDKTEQRLRLLLARHRFTRLSELAQLAAPVWEMQTAADRKTSRKIFKRFSAGIPCL